MPRRILVIEDEQKIAHWVRQYLEQAGFEVRTAADGRHGLTLAQTWVPDLVVLDLNLPGLDGMEVCRRLRTSTDLALVRLPIVMLTARVEERDRIDGLTQGADDYVSKPFSPRELVARVLALFRRLDLEATPLNRIADGDLVLDLEARTAARAGTAIPLTRTELALLACLLGRRGRAFSRAELIEAALGGEGEGSERTVDVHIRNLRRKLDEAGARPQAIETVFGLGYRYAPAAD
jgi:DNA-binding response OmpR family regulator